MKTLLFISTLLIGLASCNVASDEDYENMAGDMCECINSSTEGLSTGMVDAIVDAAKSDVDILEAIQEYTLENLETSVADGQILEDAFGNMETGCMKDLETKYEDLYSMESEAELQDKLLKILEKKDGCDLTFAIFKIGVQMQNKSL